MDRLQWEMDFMLELLSGPFSQGWKAWVWDKAKKLEATDPDFLGLPERLASSVRQQSATLSEKPGEQPGTETAAHAHTATTQLKRSTGGLPSSLLEGSLDERH